MSVFGIVCETFMVCVPNENKNHVNSLLRQDHALTSMGALYGHFAYIMYACTCTSLPGTVLYIARTMDMHVLA